MSEHKVEFTTTKAYLGKGATGMVPYFAGTITPLKKWELCSFPEGRFTGLGALKARIRK